MWSTSTPVAICERAQHVTAPKMAQRDQVNGVKSTERNEVAIVGTNGRTTLVWQSLRLTDTRSRSQTGQQSLLPRGYGRLRMSLEAARTPTPADTFHVGCTRVPLQLTTKYTASVLRYGPG